MKTSLKQHLELVKAIKAEPSLPHAIKMLREFLNANGYEDVAECKHYTISRLNGRCTTCGFPVAEPIINSSEEALHELRSKLG